MTINTATILGKIIKNEYKSVEEFKGKSKSSLLTLVVSVYTGEQKKDQDQYPPSVVYKVKLWGTRADTFANQATEGSKVVVSGKLGVPEVYTAKATGELKCTLVVYDVTQIDIMGEISPATTTGTTFTKTEVKPVAPPAASASNMTPEDMELFDLPM